MGFWQSKMESVQRYFYYEAMMHANHIKMFDQELDNGGSVMDN